MDLRLWNSVVAFEEVEVVSLVRLTNMLGKHLVIAARVIPWRRHVFLDPLSDLGIAQVDLDRAFGDIDGNPVSVTDCGQRAANQRLVMVRAGDLFGDGVSTAARLQALATSGGTLVFIG